MNSDKNKQQELQEQQHESVRPKQETRNVTRKK